MSSTCHKFYVMHKQDQGYMINAQDCNCLTQLFVKPCTHMASNCDWTFKLLVMACNRSFDILNILLAIL